MCDGVVGEMLVFPWASSSNGKSVDLGGGGKGRGNEIRKRIERFARQLGICIVIYAINEYGSSTGKSEDGTPAPVFMVNEKTPTNDVPIVPIIHFRKHFELILNGPNIVPLKEKIQPNIWNTLIIWMKNNRPTNPLASESFVIPVISTILGVSSIPLQAVPK